MNIYKPDIFASLADKITDKAPSLKRIRKSVDRTLKWLDETLDHVKVCQDMLLFPELSLKLGYDIK
jgi:queuine tRNA-ribosyltransferase subunit QTRTD1